MKPPVVLTRGKHSFLVDRFEGELHTHHGIINLEELRERDYGEEVRTHLGVKYKIVPFSPADFFRHFKRGLLQLCPRT